MKPKAPQWVAVMAAVVLTAVPIPALAGPFLGMQVHGLDDAMRVALGVEEGGFYVTDVALGGPAAEAGFLRGDLVLTVNGQGFASVKDLVAFLSVQDDQAPVTLIRRRQGTTETITITPQAWPPGWRPVKGVGKLDTLGLVVAALTPPVRERFEARWGTVGAVVTRLTPQGLAAKAGLMVGDVITMVNQTSIGGPADLVRLTALPEPGEPEAVVLLVDRDSGFVAVTLPLIKDEP